MNTQRKLRLAGLILALLTAICAACLVSWAQADTPIVISDGSLNLNSAVPWAQYTGAGAVRAHPHTTKSVTSVVANIAGTDHPVTFANQSCTVDVTYAGEHIVFSTGANGKGITMRPFTSFHPGAQASALLHNNANGHITHVKIVSGNATAFESDASGGTRITIHYQ